MIPRFVRRSIVPVCWLALGCGGGGGSGGGEAVVRDSAGITIVENAGPAWTAAQAWVVVDSPLVEIGGSETDPRLDLTQVSGVRRLADGRIAVVNGATSEVRFFGPDGGYLSTSGRRGQGPGEFQMPAGLWPVAADTLLIFDAMARRISVLAPDGSLPRTYTLGQESGMPFPSDGQVSMALPVAVLPDGSLIGMRQSFTINDPRTEAYRDTVSFIRFGADGAALDTLVRLPGMEMVPMAMSFGGQSFNSPSPAPLGRNTLVAARRGEVWFATNDGYELRVLGLDGAVQRLVRVLGPGRSVSADDQTAHRQEMVEAFESGPAAGMVPPAMKEQIRRHFADVAYPAVFPPVSELRFGDDGHLWVLETPSPGSRVRQYAVFTLEGALLGRVAMPAGFAPSGFGPDEVIGVWEDDDGVQYVRVYPLRKP